MPQKKLSELSKDEFRAHVASGQTMKLGEVNALLAHLHVDSSNLIELGIESRKERNAVHIDPADFSLLCASLVLHVHAVSAAYKREHG